MITLGLEFFKLKRRSFLFSLLAIIIIELLWSAVVIRSEMLKTHNAITAIFDMDYMNTLILPLFISILAARLLELEHLGKTFKLLQTSNESPWQLFKAKLTLMTLFSVFVALIQTIFLKFVTEVMRSSAPSLYLFFFLLNTVLVCLLLSCLHLSLAFIYEKASVTVVAGLIGAFLVFVGAGALPFIIRLFLPWQYFSTMSMAKRVATTDTYLFQYDSTYPFKLAALIVLVFLSIAISKKVMRKADLL